MARGVVSQLIQQTGFYRKSLYFYLCLLPVIGIGYYYLSTNILRAEMPLDQNWELSLSEDGALKAGKNTLNPEIFKQDGLIRYRYQIVDGLDEYQSSLALTVSLPRPGSEETIGHRFINNGGAATAESELINPQTIEFRATGVDRNAQLAIEFEIPEAFVSQTVLATLKTTFNSIPTVYWVTVSLGLPIVTLIILFLVAVSRVRSVSPLNEEVENLPTKLPPALLGVLLRGRITSREVAATLLDLARRGHLIIRQVNSADFRFRRRRGSDQLYEFEQALLDQLFGPVGEQASSDEVSFYLAQEVFSKKISQAFMLLYSKMSDLGYFYTNPLRLHRRYQVFGLFSLVLGITGFLATLTLGNEMMYLLFFWAGMIFSAFLVVALSRGLPSRTVLGDRELSKWLAFRRYLVQDTPISYQAFNQDRYLAYLPYAVIFESEVEWTRKFHNFPFAQPTWFFAPGISSIEVFANQLFPFLGHISHVLSLTSQPASR